MTNNYAIQALSKNDLAQATEVCAEAMLDNPLHIKVFGADTRLRARRLKRFFAGMLTYIQGKDSLYGVFAGGCLIGVLGMLPPKRCKPSLADSLRLLPTLLGSNSPIGTLRLAIWLTTWANIDPATPHWHLGPLAVASAWQRQGIGSRLLEYACSKGNDDSLYLETDKLSNVELYQRFGFTTLATPTILGSISWVMLRHPF